MRFLGQAQTEESAFHISNALSAKKIEHRLEVHNSIYQIWIVDEDRLQEAQEIYAHPTRTPHLHIKQQVHHNVPKPSTFRPLATCFFLILCVVIFLFEAFQATPDQNLLSPVQKELIFDLPKALESPIYANQPYWQGVYEIILLKKKTGDERSALGPLFIKIREGEVWRLFTPCLLHGNFLHILFNMIWLWVLGRPIEMRIGALRTILFTLLIGISTNTLQYLVSGPLFLGYSGVITGLAGFIWMRERITPWEGYPLNNSTILFLGLFIAGMVALQAVSFFVQLFSNLPFVLSIANTAHVFGALFGALLARLTFFDRRGGCGH